MYCLSFDKIEFKETDLERDKRQQTDVFVTPQY